MLGLADTLDTLATVTGELPSLRTGIVTTDLGTYASAAGTAAPAIGALGNGGCGGIGDDGRLQIFGAPVTDAFLIDEPDGAGGRTRNYEGELINVLATMVRGAGGGGCGFEQPFAALRRALVHPDNASFRRSTAHLGIIILADEDDCSFLDPAFLSADPRLGPLTSFRCTREGIVCNESLDEVGAKTGCRANAASPYIEALEPTLEAIEMHTPAGGVTVAAVIGNPGPIAVEERAPSGGGAPQLAVASSCSYTGPFGVTVADPGVRIDELARRFGGNGTSTSICAANLAPQLREVTRLLKHPLGVVCLDTTRLRDSDTAPGIQPTCTVTDETAAPVSSMIVEDFAACPETPDHLRLVVDATGATGMLTARCEIP